MVSVRRRRKLWLFHVVVLHRTAQKCTNACAELLLCPLYLLFIHVLVAVAVVVCLRFLLVFDKNYENIGVAGFYCATHCYAISLFAIVTIELNAIEC